MGATADLKRAILDRPGGIGTTNLITNPSYENDTTAWTPTSLVSMDRDTTRSHEGSASLKCVANGAGDRTHYGDVADPLVSGRTYVFSVWIYLEASTADFIFVRVADNGGAGPGIYTDAANGRISATGSWQRLYVIFTAASSTVHFLQVRQNGAGTSTFYVDGASLVQASTVGDYFDGDTPGYEWLGTPHGSASGLVGGAVVGLWHLGLIDGVFDDFAEDMGPNKLHGARASGTALGSTGSLVPTDRLGRATSFDGVDDEITVAHASALALTDDLTLIAAVNPTSFADFRMLITKCEGNLAAPYQWRLTNLTGVPSLLVGNGATHTAVAASAAPTAGRASLLAAVVSGTTVTHYLNGAANGSGSFGAQARADTGQSLRIGRRSDGFSFLGAMQFVAVLEDDLTAAAMLSLAQLGGFA